eukprot:COSAG02_NODE_2168_length_9608_cov_38.056893_7_plen_175_part_00
MSYIDPDVAACVHDLVSRVVQDVDAGDYLGASLRDEISDAASPNAIDMMNAEFEAIQSQLDTSNAHNTTVNNQNALLRNKIEQLQNVLGKMRDGVYTNLDDAVMCDVCGDTWHELDTAHTCYCGYCDDGDCFCETCAGQYLTIPTDEDAFPVCASCATGGFIVPYTTISELLHA